LIPPSPGITFSSPTDARSEAHIFFRSGGGTDPFFLGTAGFFVCSPGERRGLLVGKGLPQPTLCFFFFSYLPPEIFLSSSKNQIKAFYGEMITSVSLLSERARSPPSFRPSERVFSTLLPQTALCWSPDPWPLPGEEEVQGLFRAFFFFCFFFFFSLNLRSNAPFQTVRCAFSLRCCC